MRAERQSLEAAVALTVEYCLKQVQMFQHLQEHQAQMSVRGRIDKHQSHRNIKYV